jgi:hypothetical protein
MKKGLSINPKEQKSKPTGKQCSICGHLFPAFEFSYGRRDDRSYCRKCDKEEKAAYRRGGSVAAREYRDNKRKEWKT